MTSKRRSSPSRDQNPKAHHGQSSARKISLGSIRLDGGTQTRVNLDKDVVEEYAENMAGDGAAAFPPVIVFHDEQNDYWLADGFHRVAAAQNIGISDIAADVREGSRFDAFTYSLGANRAHGLRRTNADKRHSVTLALCEQDLCNSSDHVIADLCGVSNHLVADVRRDHKQRLGSQVGNSPTSTVPTKRKGRDGKMHPARKRERGKKSAVQVPGCISSGEPEPPISDARLTDDRPIIETDILRGTSVPGDQISSLASADVERLEHKPEHIVSEGNGLVEVIDVKSSTDRSAPCDGNHEETVSLRADTRNRSSDGQNEVANPSRWNNGVISWERVEERLSKITEVYPSNRYTHNEQQAFAECFTELVRAVNRLAEMTCVAQDLRPQVATDSAVALAKTISTSPKEQSLAQAPGRE